jgi:hypothetical protein
MDPLDAGPIRFLPDRTATGFKARLEDLEWRPASLQAEAEKSELVPAMHRFATG